MRMWKKRVPSYTVGWNINWCNDCGKNMKFPQKIKNKLPMILCLFPEYLYKKYENTNLKRYMHPYSLWQLQQPSCENNLSAINE